MHKLANVSLANRALIALITVFALAFGVVTTTNLKQELIPPVSFPSAFVVAEYQGASPQVMEEKVTVPIERAILSLENLETYTSTSATGISQVRVDMRYGTNMSIVQQDLRAALSRIENFLPEGVTTSVFTASFEDFPVLVVAASDETEVDDLARRLTDLTVPDWEKLPGVRSVQVTGGRERRVLVSLNQDKLKSNGLTSAEVMQAIGSSGSLASGGKIDIENQTLSVTVGSRYTSAKDVGDITVIGQAVSPTGKQAPKPVQISDLGEVTEELAPVTSVSRTNGKAAISLSVTKTPDASTVDVSRAVLDALPAAKDKLGTDVVFTTAFDQAPFISESIDDLLTEGGIGLAMAVFVILLFLLSARSTIVTAISIPVSILTTMIGISIAGYSLNIFTLGALTIAIGRVVDDSIVVIENINRHLAYGEPKLKAILTAVKEVATAVTSATITTVAVFLPMALVGGQIGELFRPFAFTTSLALLASLAVSLTIIPVLAYWFLKPKKVTRTLEEIEEAEHNSWLQRIYVPALKFSLKHPVLVILATVLLLGGTVAATPLLMTNFLGDSGQNTLRVSQSFPPALSLDEQVEAALKTESALRKTDNVDVVQTIVGTLGGEAAAFGFGGTSGSATFILTTNPEKDQEEITADVRKAVKPFIKDDAPITVGSPNNQGNGDIEVIVTAPDTVKLAKASEAITSGLADIPNTSDVSSTLEENQPQIEVKVDREQAAKVGLNEATIGMVVRGLLAESKAGTVELTGGRTIDIIVKSDTPAKSLAELKRTKLPTAVGEIQLSEVAEVTKTNVAVAVAHNEGQRSVTVSLSPISDDLGAITAEVQSKLDGIKLPDGAQAKIGGVSAEQSNAFTQLGLALLAAIAIVYVVMVATFKSLVQPLILAASIPFAATGALVALLATGTPLGVPALIGTLMLVGIVVTNAIVLIDLVNQYRRNGDTVPEALVDGARQRLRPVIMTAVATIFALVPMALGFSGGGVFVSKPLAVVVIGGLISSTLLTLILVPVLYQLVEGRREKRQLKKRLASLDDDPDTETTGARRAL